MGEPWEAPTVLDQYIEHLKLEVDAAEARVKILDWARYNGFPRPDRKGARRDGWDACDEELRDERSLAVQRGWDTRRQGPHRLAPAGLAALREGRGA